MYHKPCAQCIVRHLSALLIILVLSACKSTLPTLKLAVTSTATAPNTAVVIATTTPEKLILIPTVEPAPTLAPSPTPESSYQPGAIVRYGLIVDLDYAHHTASVSQTITITNSSPDTWNYIVLHVPASRIRGVFTITGGKWTSDPAVQAEYVSDAETLAYHFNLPRPLPPGASNSLFIHYVLNLPVTSLKDWPPTGDLGYNNRVMQFGNWAPVLVPYQPGKGWYTWKFVEVGDPYVTEEAAYDLEIHAAESVVIASGGLPEHTLGTWRFHLEQARAIGFSASPDYRLIQADIDGVTVSSFYLAGHELAGRDVLSATLRSLRLFSQLYGPYPYTTFTIAEDAFFGSMEYTAFVLHSGEGYAGYSGRPDSTLIALTPHEIAHQWWYSLVGTDQVREPWLDEGLAMYSELAFYREYYPALEDWFWSSRVNIYHPSGLLTRSIYDFPDSRTYIHQLYRRGVLFFNDLRQVLGHDSYYAFLQDLRRQGEHQIITTEQFLHVLDRYIPAQETGVIAKYFQDSVKDERLSTPDVTPIPTAISATIHPAESSQINYVVQNGDTLWRISTTFGISVEALQAANHLTSSIISIGQVLIIRQP